MTTRTLARYRNLFANIANWPHYFLAKRQPGFAPRRFVTTRNALRFEVTSIALYAVFKEIFLEDFYTIRALAKALPRNPVVIDVGANAGYFCLLLFSKRPDAQAYAYEPIPENHELFTKHLAWNPSMARQLRLHHAAVTGRPVESVELFREPDQDQSVTASVFKDFATHNRASVRVPAVTLASIMYDNKLTRVDLLKLDCEGSEYPIVYDTPAELWPAIQSIFLEVHDLDNDRRNVGAITRFLEAQGYRCSHEAAKNGCWALVARRNEMADR